MNSKIPFCFFLVIVLLASTTAYAQSPQHRNSAIRRQFLHSFGLSHTPSGSQCDHWVPLHCGGTDTIDNFRLTNGEYMRAKEQAERNCKLLPQWIKEHPCLSPSCRAYGDVNER